MAHSTEIDRREFLAGAAAVGAAAGMASVAGAAEPARVRVGVIGCGSVSHQYLPHLTKCRHVELISTCDIIPERAKAQAEKFKVPNHYPHIDKMLAGAAFDLLVNLTDMQEHEHLNRQAVEAGKHVWSEKPMANSLDAGQKLLEAAKEKKVRIWGAPAMVVSPQFAFMAKTMAAGKLGKPAAAHAEYGHSGPDWSAFFYEKGGGSLPDLAVYNLTTLTGVLGPAKAVTAMTSVITPTRKIRGKGEIKVVAEDNAMVLMDHGNGLISHVQSGFNYFNPHGHEGSKEQRYTVSVYGTIGFMGLVGYDWEPNGVDLATKDQPAVKRHATDRGDFVWQMGASLAAECLATGKDLLITPEHALHVLEVIQATRESQDTGRRVPLRSTFKWPVVT
ncbi:MAG TPA: Gfo/Idh/MocA family oxidoreductase [Gemmataceae bacterium]|nr:Gfo/Idh/MocA family oxidoreductase [Gemmataceae bacterium]